MSGSSFCRRFLAVAGLTLIATLMAISASADPDPPFVDGGTTTFSDDWVVDPGDVLTYTNQTIVMDGNLTIEANGVLELVNSTLVMNCTFPGEFGVNVLHQGWWNVTLGSRIVTGGPGNGWYAVVESGAHLSMYDSTVQGAGYGSVRGILRAGIYSEANDTSVLYTTFQDCYTGLAMVNVSSPTVQNSFFVNMSYAGIWIGSGCSGIDLKYHNFTSCERGVLIGGSGVTVSGGRFIGGSWGIQPDF